jgi:hypothetical protein
VSIVERVVPATTQKIILCDTCGEECKGEAHIDYMIVSVRAVVPGKWRDGVTQVPMHRHEDDVAKGLVTLLHFHQQPSSVGQCSPVDGSIAKVVAACRQEYPQ